MNKVKRFLKEEASGWKVFDVAWLLIATAVILGLSIYWKDNMLSYIYR